jgi:hypothetical protein
VNDARAGRRDEVPEEDARVEGEGERERLPAREGEARLEIYHGVERKTRFRVRRA